MEILVPFDDISVEWEELKQTLQGCEDSLMVASRLQSFIQVEQSLLSSLRIMIIIRVEWLETEEAVQMGGETSNSKKVQASWMTDVRT